MKIAYQGSSGAYSEIAASKFASKKEAQFFQCTNFAEVVKLVTKRKVEFGVLPVENALSGSIGESYNLLIKNNIFVAREIILPIHHSLVSIREANLNTIKVVYSHPQALLQCKKFIDKQGYEAKVFYDTAASAKKVKEMEDREVAAIASNIAAKVYDLKTIKRNIEDNHENYTRFLIVSGKSSLEGDKSTIVVKIPHKSGSLVNFLSILKNARLNLTKIESRPIVGRPWEYLFIIDFKGKLDKALLEEAKARTTFWRHLGTYKSGSV